MSRRRKSAGDVWFQLVKLIVLLVVLSVFFPSVRTIVAPLLVLSALLVVTMIVVHLLKRYGRTPSWKDGRLVDPARARGGLSLRRRVLPSFGGERTDSRMDCVLRTDAEILGAKGERELMWRLKWGLDMQGYRMMQDVYLPLDDGTTTQIDAIVVSEAGIFVIEMKNYSGWVFGRIRDPKWTQSLCGKGRKAEKHSFQNPIRQNYRHICALSDCLGIEAKYFRSVVVFPDAGCLKGEISDNAVRLSNGIVDLHTVASFIKDPSPALIKAKQLDEIVSAIGEWQATIPDEVKSAHIDNLKHRNGRV